MSPSKTSMLSFKHEVFLHYEDIVYLMTSSQYHELLSKNHPSIRILQGGYFIEIVIMVYNRCTIAFNLKFPRNNKICPRFARADCYYFSGISECYRIPTVYYKLWRISRTFKIKSQSCGSSIKLNKIHCIFPFIFKF